MDFEDGMYIYGIEMCDFGELVMFIVGEQFEFEFDELIVMFQFDDQEFDGSNVIVMSVNFFDGGYIVIFDENGLVVGVIDYFDFGLQENVIVLFFELLSENESVNFMVQVYFDINDNQMFDFFIFNGIEDGLYMVNGMFVIDDVVVIIGEELMMEELMIIDDDVEMMIIDDDMEIVLLIEIFIYNEMES